MKKTLVLVFSAVLLVALSAPAFAQTGGSTGGSTGQGDNTKSSQGKAKSKEGQKGHKGGKKGKKGSGGTTTPPPK